MKLSKKREGEKQVKKAIVSGLIVVFVLSFGFGLLNYSPIEVVSAASSKKAPIHINNTAGSALSYYQVNLNITYDPDMNNNFSDIRVKNETAGTFIPYWIEDKLNGSWCNLWFNATSIPASAWCNDTYYLYYGDAAASSASNGTNTFEFFDDFDWAGTTKNETYLTNWTKSGSNPLQNKTCQNWFIAVYSNYNNEDKIYIFEQRDDSYNNTIEAWSFTRANASNPANWTDHGIIYTSSEAWGGAQPHHIEPHGIFFETQSMADAREGVGEGLGTRKWRMYYNLHVSLSSNAQVGFMVASEDNLLSWTPYPNNPVYPKDSYGRADCKVCIYNDQVWMHLCKYDASACVVAYFAVSDTGLEGSWTDKTRNWASEETILGTMVPFSTGILLSGTNTADTACDAYFTTDGNDKATYSGNPILSGGGATAWDNNIYWYSIPVDKNGSADLNDAGTYYLYYIGHLSGAYKIGLATSTTLTEESETFFLDDNKWTDAGAGSYSIADGKLTLTNPKYIQSLSGYTGGYAVRSRQKVGTDTVGSTWGGFIKVFGGSNVGTCIAWYASSTLTYFNYNSGDGVGCDFGNFASIYETANYHIAEARRTGSADTFVFDSDPIKTGSHPHNSSWKLGFEAYSADLIIDWILVRKYTSPEPTALLGNEQTAEGGGCTTPVITDLTNSTPGTTNVTITWTTNQSADNRVKYSKNNDLSNELWSSWSNDTSSISIDISSLDSGIPYYYQAWSYNGTNSSCYVTEPTSQPYKNFTTQTTGGAYEITLLSGWNIIGWTDTTTRTAHYVGTDIGSNCTYVTERNKTSGQYVNHNMGGPEGEDNFAIERGWGYYAYLSSETVWNRTA